MESIYSLYRSMAEQLDEVKSRLHISETKIDHYVSDLVDLETELLSLTEDKNNSKHGRNHKLTKCINNLHKIIKNINGEK